MKRSWPCVVCDWIERRAKKEGKEGVDLTARESPFQTAPPALESRLEPRFLHELDTYIRLAEEGSTRHAWWIVTYFYWTKREGKSVDPRVLHFLECAWQRYRADPRRNIAKSLRLVRSIPGNAGGVSRKRRMTPESGIEAGLMVLELQNKGMSENAAVLTVVEKFQASERTIRKAAAEQRQIGGAEDQLKTKRSE